jgi:hypothetical protein
MASTRLVGGVVGVSTRLLGGLVGALVGVSIICVSCCVTDSLG